MEGRQQPPFPALQSQNLFKAGMDKFKCKKENFQHNAVIIKGRGQSKKVTR